MKRKCDRDKQVNRKDAFSADLKESARDQPNSEKWYTVVGYWADTMQRFADSFLACNPEKAEKLCLAGNDDLSVCGVIEGKHACVDIYPYVRQGEDLKFKNE